MHSELLVILLALTAGICWGFSDFFAAKSAKTVGPILAAVLVNVIGSSVFLLAYLFFMHGPAHVSTSGLYFAIGTGVSFAIAGAAFFVGLDAGPVSIVSPVSSTYPLVTTLLAVAAFRANLSVTQIIAILIIILGVMAAAGILNPRKSGKKMGKGPTFAIIAALGWGTGYALLAQAMKRLGYALPTAIEFVVVAVLLVAFTPLIKGKERIDRSTILKGFSGKFIISAGLIQLAGVVALNLAVSKSIASGGAIATAISACYPILTIFLALRSFDEEKKLIPLMGAILGIIGVVILSIS